MNNTASWPWLPPLTWLLAILLLPCSALAQQPAKVPGETVSATLDLKEEFTEGLSLLWSPTGQDTWDQMRVYHNVKSIDLEPPTPIVDVLNAFVWNQETTLPENTFIYGGDDSEQKRNEIRDTLRKRHGAHAAAMIGPYQPPGYLGHGVTRIKSALFVSSISHSPKFPATFAPSKGPFRLSDGSSILARGFGCSGHAANNYVDAVQVLADDLRGSVIMRFTFVSAANETPAFMLVAMRPNLKSLNDALTWMKTALKNPAPADQAVSRDGRWWRWRNELTPSDQLWMPLLKTTLACDYGELIGKTYLRQKDATGEYLWRIREAQQLLSFRLDEHGALAQAVFKVAPDFLSVGGEGGGLVAKPTDLTRLPPLPRHFLFNSPFVAALWMKGADWPYLACWVDSESVLTK